jgi:hypothetical protein
MSPGPPQWKRHSYFPSDPLPKTIPIQESQGLSQEPAGVPESILRLLVTKGWSLPESCVCYNLCCNTQHFCLLGPRALGGGVHRTLKLPILETVEIYTE